MQNIISANQKSITEAEATKDALIPYYSSSKALPELGVQFQKVGPFISFTSGSPASNTIIWKLPPGAGFLLDASIGISFTGAVVTADLLGNVGLNCVGQIDWLSNGQPFLTYTGAALKALVKTLPVAEQMFIYRYAKPLKPSAAIQAAFPGPNAAGEPEDVAVNGDITFMTYIPLLASFLTSTEKALLLNQIGDIQIRLTFATATQFGMTTAPTAITAGADATVLHVKTYMPKLSVYNQMVLNDWSKTLIMECFNTYTEVMSSLGSTTSSGAYTITCPFLVYRTSLFLQQITAAATYPTQEISTVTINIGGVPLMDNTLKSRLIGTKAKAGLANFEVSAANVVSYDDKPFAVIDWNAYSTRDRNTGTAFFQELRGSTINVTYSTLTAANFNLIIVHEYWNNVAYQPGSGGGNGMLSVFSNN